MSRGPGRWQRVLLAALRDNEAILVVGVACQHLGRNTTRAEEVSVRRAARALAESGQARAIYEALPTVDGGRVTHQLVLTPPDSTRLSTLLPVNAPDWIARSTTS